MAIIVFEILCYSVDAKLKEADQRRQRNAEKQSKTAAHIRDEALKGIFRRFSSKLANRVHRDQDGSNTNLWILNCANVNQCF